MVNERAEASAPSEFSFKDEEHHQSTRRRIVAVLRVRIVNCDNYLSEACLYELADDVIEKCVLGGELDPQKNPLAYMANQAYWRAVRTIRTRPPVDLMETVALDACTPDQDAHHADCPPWESSARQAAEDCRTAVLRAWRELPMSQLRTVMELRINGLTSEDAAEKLGIPVNQVYQQWHKAVKRLRSDPAVQPRVRTSHVTRGKDSSGRKTLPGYQDRSE
ncbi:sigma-70 family RNA polymerase sigma factor [Streptomyces longwoodensis]|uniref:RNA polymerase sigma factor n=1 Tax=Streptomyces longwoodensis TaxID=68231 RepID=UPI0033DE86FD